MGQGGVQACVPHKDDLFQAGFLEGRNNAKIFLLSFQGKK